MADSGKVLTQEENLARQVGEGNLSGVIEVWVASRKCFVLGKNYVKRLKKSGKIDRVRKKGVPVYIRLSGGEAILHDDTCLNFGVIVSPLKICLDPFRIDKVFTILSCGVIQCLRKMKIPVYFGKTKLFCPGPYDLLVEGKKIAGISLSVRKNLCLLHGTLFVNTGADYLEQLKIFYPSLSDEITSLRILLGKGVDMKNLSIRIIDEYKTSLKINRTS